jgi:hypothetical protein
MSRSNGLAKFEDGTILAFVYDGTSDTVNNGLFDRVEESWSGFYKHACDTCKCGKDEPVTLCTDYGKGSCWQGRACRHCRCIKDGKMPYDDNLPTISGIPDWAKECSLWDRSYEGK